MVRLLQVSDEKLVVYQSLCSRLMDRQQSEQPSSDVTVIDGRLSNYETLVSSCIDSVIRVTYCAINSLPA